MTMAASGAKKAVDHWAKQAFKPSHKGRLYKALGVPLGEKIPAPKMRAALAGKHGSKARAMAQAAKNI
jgi:hypothetical protein